MSGGIHIPGAKINLQYDQQLYDDVCLLIDMTNNHRKILIERIPDITKEWINSYVLYVVLNPANDCGRIIFYKDPLRMQLLICANDARPNSTKLHFKDRRPTKEKPPATRSLPSRSRITQFALFLSSLTLPLKLTLMQFF